VAAAVVVSVHVLVLGVIKLKIKPNAETVQLIVLSLWVLGTNQARTVMVRIWHEHMVRIQDEGGTGYESGTNCHGTNALHKTDTMAEFIC
jgi:hypothetical protein